MKTTRVLISLAARFSKYHFSMVSGYSSRTCMIRHCLKKGTRAQWKGAEFLNNPIQFSSSWYGRYTSSVPLLPLLDQQLTQSYLLAQYQSFLYFKKKAMPAGTDATTGALPPPLLEVSRISYWSRYSCYHNEGTSAKESATIMKA